MTVAAKLAVALMDAQQNLAKTQYTLAEVAKVLIQPVPDPDGLSFVVTGVEMSQFKFKAILPELPTDPDLAKIIVSGELTLQIGTQNPVVIETAKTQTEVRDLICDPVDVIHGSFVWLDEFGKKSDVPAIFTGVLEDPQIVPNPDPGSLTFQAYEVV